MQNSLEKQNRISKPLQYALAFLIPFLGYIGVMICAGHTPFGHSSILYSDMYHQYFPFFLQYHRTLRSGGILLYSWNMGMGVDYLSLIAYYLASPLNLLSVVLPESWMLPYFSLMVPVKLGLAGLFFAIFLEKTVSSEGDPALPVFGGCYGLCAWALGYQWNIMWLDTFALLPLVILGMISMLKERRFFLYTFTLFLSVVSNYYIGFFTCIFVALSFLCYEICYWKNWRRFLGDLGMMFLFSLLALAMTAFLELPAFIGLGRTNSSVNQFPTGFAMNIAKEKTILGLLDAMRQVAGNTAGGITPTFKEGLPNLYCGIFPLVLLFQFLATKKFKFREKLCGVMMLVFFMLSFILRQLDYIWHGFHFTNMIPYRFSFLFSFVVLFMAFKAYRNLDNCKPWKVMFSAFMFLAVAACSNNLMDPVFIAFNLVFLAIYTVLLLLRKLPRKVKAETEDGPKVEIILPDEDEQGWNRRVASLLCVAMLLEMICSLVCFGVGFGGTSVTNYPRGTDDTRDVIAHMEALEKDSDFYRAEVTHTQTLNDDALIGYNGITMFSSAVDVRVTRFMVALGFGAKPSYNRYAYEEASPVANLFLNLKYQICRDGKPLESVLNRHIYNMGKIYLLENTAYLPLGFMADSALTEMDVDRVDAGSFAFQNALFASATGLSGNVYANVTEYQAKSDKDTTAVRNQGKAGWYTYTTEEADDVTVSFTVPKAGFVCLDISATKRNDISIWKNGYELYSESLSLDQMLAVGDCEAGDQVEVVFTCKGSEDGRIDFAAAILNMELFQEGVDKLRAGSMDILERLGTGLKGSVTASEGGILYTSIPYSENWHAKVDGQDVEITPILNAMIGLKLTEGEHLVELRYENPEFRLGCLVSGAALAVVLVLTLLAYMPRKKGKYAK